MAATAISKSALSNGGGSNGVSAGEGSGWRNNGVINRSSAKGGQLAAVGVSMSAGGVAARKRHASYQLSANGVKMAIGWPRKRIMAGGGESGSLAWR